MCGQEREWQMNTSGARELRLERGLERPAGFEQPALRFGEAD